MATLKKKKKRKKNNLTTNDLSGQEALSLEAIFGLERLSPLPTRKKKKKKKRTR